MMQFIYVCYFGRQHLKQCYGSFDATGERLQNEGCGSNFMTICSSERHRVMSSLG